jgi:aryl-alcohol dehydrogenase-like predicted oxidoreductase
VESSGPRLPHWEGRSLDERFDSCSDLRTTFPLYAGSAEGESAVLDLLARIGAKKKATPAQIALAWLLAQKPWIVPIPSTRRLDRLEENLGAVQIELSSDDLREIDHGFSKITVQGARLSEAHMQLIDR